MEHRDFAALAKAAQALHASIRQHKTAQESHRRQAKRDSIALAGIRALFDRHGLTLEITETPSGRESQ
jgi:hypothetical protein